MDLDRFHLPILEYLNERTRFQLRAATPETAGDDAEACDTTCDGCLIDVAGQRGFDPNRQGSSILLKYARPIRPRRPES